MAFAEPWPAPMRLDLSGRLPDEGVRVSLKVAFAGTSAAAWLVLATNSLNPLLRLYNDSLETRVVRRVRHRYPDIALAEVEAMGFSRTPSVLNLTWRGEGLQFLGRPMLSKNLPLVLQFLADKEVPLGPEARALIDGAP